MTAQTYIYLIFFSLSFYQRKPKMHLFSFSAWIYISWSDYLFSDRDTLSWQNYKSKELIEQVTENAVYKITRTVFVLPECRNLNNKEKIYSGCELFPIPTHTYLRMRCLRTNRRCKETNILYNKYCEQIKSYIIMRMRERIKGI